MPPSGPTTSSTSPSAGRARPAKGVRASSCSTTASAAPATRVRTSAPDASGATTGTRARRDCLAAARTVCSHLRRDRSPRSPFHTTTLRAACQGTTSSTPSSVAASTARSSRSPLASAWTSTNRGEGSGTDSSASTRRLRASRALLRTVQRATAPMPSATSTRSPAVIRRTVAACRPSAPSSASCEPIAAPASAPASSRNSGALTSGSRRSAERSPTAQRVLQPAEQAAAVGRQPALGTLLAAERSQLGEQPALCLVQVLRRLDVDVHDEVAAPAAAQVGDAQPAQGRRLAGLGARLDVQLLRAVQRLQGHGRSESGRGHRQPHGGVQVVPAADEGLVRREHDLDVEVAGRPVARADLTLAGELDAGAGVDTGRDLDREVAPRAHASLARALDARVGDHGAVPLAGGARAGGHHRAEERALRGVHLAAAAADVAPPGAGARLGALAVAGGAADGGVDRDLPLAAEDGLGEVDLHPDERVLAAPLPRARTTLGAALAPEEGVHDVGERE